MSPSSSAARRARPLRAAGVIALLVLQAGAAFTVYSYPWREGTDDVSRAARLAAIGREAAGSKRSVFPTLIGYVDRLGDDTLLVVAAERGHVIRIDAHTHVEGIGGPTGWSSLRPGSGVVVYGGRTPDHAVLADVVLIGPAS